MTKERADKKWFVPFLIGPLVIVLLIGVVQFLKPHKPSWAEQGRHVSGTNAFGIWASASYSPIMPGEALRKQVEQFAIVATNASITPDQDDKLREAAYNVIAAFHTGNYDLYRKFRRPVRKGKWNSTLYEFRRSSLQKYASRLISTGALDEESIDQDFFQFLALTTGYTRDGLNVLETNADTSAAPESLGFFTGLSLENCSFAVETRTNLPDALDLTATKTENDGYFSATSSFVFDLTPQKVIKLRGAVTFATLRLLIQSKRDKPMPVYYRLYWVDEYHEWLPYEHCIPSTFRVNYLIF